MATEHYSSFYLPNELWIIVLSFHFASYIADARRKWKQDLHRRLKSPSAPWNKFRYVCKLWKRNVQSALDPYIIFHPEGTKPTSGLPPQDGPLWFPRRLYEAHIILMFFDMSLGSAALECSTEENWRSLPDVTAAMSTDPNLFMKVKELYVTFGSLSYHVDNAHRDCAGFVWELDPQMYPSLKHLSLDSVPCRIINPTFPPCSLTQLDLTRCEIASGMDGLLDILHKLQSLEEIALSGLVYSFHAHTIHPQRWMGRTVRLPHLETISLEDEMQLLGIALSSLELPVITHIALKRVGMIWDSKPVLDLIAALNTHLSNANTVSAFTSLAVSMRGNAPVLDLRATSLHAPWTLRVSSSDIPLNEEDWHLSRFLSGVPTLRSVAKLIITPFDTSRPRGSSLIELRKVLRCLERVEELEVVGSVNCNVWKALCAPDDGRDEALLPGMRLLTIKMESMSKSERRLLADCVRRRGKVLHQIIFEFWGRGSAKSQRRRLLKRLRTRVLGINIRVRKLDGPPEAMVERLESEKQ